MCGRLAQTLTATSIAEKILFTPTHHEEIATASATPLCYPSGGNFNLSPGMSCDVMLVNENGDFHVDRKKWGLITKHGTAKKPLHTEGSEVIKLCFESQCFNARSETLYSKPTFSKLALRGRTCIIAVDGYFEWKSHPIPKMNKIKQPYFVYRKHQLDQDSEKHQRKKEPLLIAGIWTRVTTGKSDTPELGSFAMLTTEASDQLKWLHHRMPVCVWDIALAKQWLTQPSEALKKKLDDAARYETNGFDWHKVTPEMSKLSFRSEESIIEIKEEETQSIMRFFASGRSLANETVKDDMKYLSSHIVGTDENENKVKRTSCAQSASTGTDGSPKEFAPTVKRDGKRQLTLSSAYSSQSKKSCKKSKLKRSSTLNSNKQISINSFFYKKKK